jgi:hypothetical protein
MYLAIMPRRGYDVYMTSTMNLTSRPRCAQCAGFDEDRAATKIGYYPPERHDQRCTRSEFLCDTCACAPTYINIRPLDDPK